MLAALLGVGSPVACAAHAAGVDPVVSDSGALRVETVMSPDPPQRGLDGADLTVTNVGDGGAVDGLTIAVSPWMPAMNHGTSLVPTVTALGSGKYSVTNLDLFMPGHWLLRLSFSGPVTDHAAPAVDIP